MSSRPPSETSLHKHSGHNLPQLPSMTPMRVAVSKSSCKSDPPVEDNPFANVVSLEDVEGKTNTPTSERNTAPALTSLPTPPSDKSSHESPPKSHLDISLPEINVISPSPIKLRIHRSPDHGGKLTSTVNEENAHTTPEKSSGRARTKEDIKNQLLKRKGEHQSRRNSRSPAPSENEKQVTSSTSPLLKSPEQWDKKRSKPQAASSLVVEEEGVRYLVGDMVWSKVSGHPYWPSMVSFDPFTGIYTKLYKGKIRQFHVQFFGNEGERGWIMETAMVTYEGRRAFESWTATKLKTAKSSDKKKYQVPPARRKAWEVAVKSAEQAYPLAIEQRKMQYTFQYVPVQPNAAERAAAAAMSKSKKRKLSISAAGSCEGDEEVISPSQLQPRKKRRRSKNKEVISNSGEGNGTDRSRTQFLVFCQKRRDMREHPVYTDAQIEEMLLQQWQAMTEEDQAKFIPMGSDVKHVQQKHQTDNKMEGSSGSKRTPKSSKKRRESDDVGGRRKSRKRSSVARTLLPSTASTTASGSTAESSTVEEVINAVAAGGGTVWQYLDHDDGVVLDLGDLSSSEATEALEPVSEVTDMLATKKARQQARKASPRSQDELDETSSQASSCKEDSGTAVPPRKRQSLAQMVQQADADDFDIELFKLCSTDGSRKENICAICEQPGELLLCEGPCFGAYHLSCLGLTVSPPGTFKCDECGTGRHTCFICKKAGSDTRQCRVNHCGKFYHPVCLANFSTVASNEGSTTNNPPLQCPLHACATCAAITPNNVKNTKGRMYKCVRCPTAYHVGDFCVAAGSIHLAGLHIVCSKHFAPLKAMSHHSRINVSWCFNCSKGGTLLCCDMCPAAYHTSCLKIEQPAEGEQWLCSDCRLGRRPLYGDIIWVKLGSYRWWPGEICHPKNVPHNIQEKAHQVGEFPIHFFGSHDYFWTHMGRVFLFQEGDKGSKELANAKGLVKVFQKAVHEATRAFQLYKKAKEALEKMELDKVEKKPLPYKLVKLNFPIGNVLVRKVDMSEIPRCDCKSDPCGQDSECINRMMMCECHPAVCSHADKCQNQRFTKRLYPQTQIERSDGCGWGLKTLQEIKKGDFVNEYVGDLIDEEECRRRIKQAHCDNITNFYMLTMDGNRVIDAGPKGNYSRFMNHSCDPNCETQKWMVNGDLRIGLFAVRDIAIGENLTFNYNLECRGDEKTVCKCGADICSGFLGVRPKTQIAAENERKVVKKKKKKKVAKRTEDECYRCGDGGELVMCDKKDCPKAYHLECLNMAKPPHGQWTCPWHFCDLCEKRARKLCVECPNSFCPEHIEGNIFLVPENRLICSDHTDLLEAMEASKLHNEPIKAGSASDTTSSCDSQTASDGESSAAEEKREAMDKGVIVNKEKITGDVKKEIAEPEMKTKVKEEKEEGEITEDDEDEITAVKAENPPNKVNGHDAEDHKLDKKKSRKSESKPDDVSGKPIESDVAERTPKSAAKSKSTVKNSSKSEKRKSSSKSKRDTVGKKSGKSASSLHVSASNDVDKHTSDLPPVIFNDDSDNDNLVIDL